MAKKGFGKFVAFAAVAGAVAAGVSYIFQYKTFHKELEKDFREFEEDGEDDSLKKGPQEKTGQDDSSQEQTAEGQAGQGIGNQPKDPRRGNRNYISLASSRDEFKVAAKDMAQATKNVLKDAGTILSDTAHEAMSAAVDTAHMAIHTVKSKKEEFAESRAEEPAEDDDLFEDEGFLDDDYMDDDDLFDYGRMDGEDFRESPRFHTARSAQDYSEELIEDAPEPAAAAPGTYEEGSGADNSESGTVTTSIEEDTAQ